MRGTTHAAEYLLIKALACIPNLPMQADSRSSLIKVHFDQLSACDFWCCLCSRILRQPQGSTSNLNKHLQARHPSEWGGITGVMAEDSVVKVEDAAGILLFSRAGND